MKFRLFTRENLWALILTVVVIVLVIVSASKTPIWIYQGY